MKIDDFILLALKRLYNWYKNTSLPEKKNILILKQLNVYLTKRFHKIVAFFGN